MKIALFSTLVLLSCLAYVTSAPLFEFDDFDISLPDISSQCTDLGCPSGSTSCGKRTSTSADRNTIIEEIKCFGANGQTTKDETQEKPNPNPGSIQSGYEYFGSYTGGTQTIHVGDGRTPNTGNDNVETFAK